jgi:uncharacterized protein YuzE
MRIEYDPEADGAYIWLIDDIDARREDCINEIWPKELNGHVGLLLDKEGKIMGIEILPASKYLGSELLK